PVAMKPASCIMASMRSAVWNARDVRDKYSYASGLCVIAFAKRGTTYLMYAVENGLTTSRGEGDISRQDIMPPGLRTIYCSSKVLAMSLTLRSKYPWVTASKLLSS